MDLSLPLLMKILVIGAGAREHALVWKLHQSSQVDHIWSLPGNAGMAKMAECIAGNVTEIQEIADAAQRLRPDFTVVGPEQPLVRGIADEFERRGLRILGPSKLGARLEGSKIFAKEFMVRHGIPTAPTYGVFDNAVDAYTSLCEVDWPVVIKADGLCAGKGVLVTSSPDEATAFIELLMEKGEFGEAGKHVIVEEGLKGREISYIVLTDGENFRPLAPSRDYKRAFDGDSGPNTGGMGAISTNDLLTREQESEIQEKIVKPTLAGMNSDGQLYKGFLYFGLMMTDAGPKVLEFNCRLGDPEAEALVMRMNFDLAAAIDATLSGGLKNFQMNWAPEASACIVLAASGYPGRPDIGKEVRGLPATEGQSNTAIFHAGTREDHGIYYTHSGRVLMVATAGSNVNIARSLAYKQAGQISFEGMHYRKDIGSEATSVAGI